MRMHALGWLHASRQVARARRALAVTRQGIFTVTFAFADGGGAAFTPDRQTVLEVVNANVLDGCLALAAAAPRLLTMRSFGQHFATKPTGLDLASVVRCALLGAWRAADGCQG